jgi:hypothetical protein
VDEDQQELTLRMIALQSNNFDELVQTRLGAILRKLMVI